MTVTYATFFERLESSFLLIAAIGFLLGIPLYFIRNAGSTVSRQIALEFLGITFLGMSALVVTNAQPFSVSITGHPKPLILTAVWISGFLVSLTVLIWKNISFRQHFQVLPMQANLKHIIDTEVKFQGITLPNVVAVHKSPLVAAVHGKALYLDSELASRFAESQIRLIVRHELVHIKNNHWVRALLSSVLCCVFWWHPAMHWLKNELSIEREIQADAIAGAEDPLLYAETLRQIMLDNYRTPALAIQCHAGQRRWSALGSKMTHKPVFPAALSILSVLLLSAPLLQPVRHFQVIMRDNPSQIFEKGISGYPSKIKMRVSAPSSSRKPAVVLRSKLFQDHR